MASWAEDQERGQRFDDLLREEPGAVSGDERIEALSACWGACIEYPWWRSWLRRYEDVNRAAE